MKEKPVLPQTTSPDSNPAAAPGAPGHDEWLVDESIEETFPASDPPAPRHPREDPGKIRSTGKKK